MGRGWTDEDLTGTPLLLPIRLLRIAHDGLSAGSLSALLHHLTSRDNHG
jgi:hypothetical protein